MVKLVKLGKGMAATMPGAATPGPVVESARITSLDLIRGVSVLAILLMNAISNRYEPAPYLNLSAGGPETWPDWAMGAPGRFLSTGNSWPCSPCCSARRNGRGAPPPTAGHSSCGGSPCDGYDARSMCVQ